MNVLTNLLSLLGDNYLTTGIIPSMTFMVAILWVFDPIIKTSTLFQQQNGSEIYIWIGTLLIIPLIILSYTLMALNTYILKIYSGYTFLSSFPFMRKAQIRDADDLISMRNALKGRIRDLETKTIKTARHLELLRSLKVKYYSVCSEYEQSFPPSTDDILPTRFGNILKASEAYAGTRYGFDGVAFWPLLIAVIPPEYQKTIDGARNELVFVVNMSLLSIVFFLFCVIGIILSCINPFGTTIQFTWSAIAFRYIIAGIIALFSNIFFNQAALYSVSSFGMMIRSAFDLFRIDLLKQFKLKMPVDSREEFYTWKNLNEFIVLGRHSLNFKKLEYRIKE